MKHLLLWVVGIIIVLVAAFYALNAYIYNEKQADTSIYTFGTYGYRCGDGTEFTMSLPEDISSIHLVPATSVERIPETILSKVASETGARFEGDGIVFHAHGETVELSTSEFTTTCLPMSVPDEPPFNFGD